MPKRQFQPVICRRHFILKQRAEMCEFPVRRVIRRSALRSKVSTSFLWAVAIFLLFSWKSSAFEGWLTNTHRTRRSMKAFTNRTPLSAAASSSPAEGGSANGATSSTATSTDDTSETVSNSNRREQQQQQQQRRRTVGNWEEMHGNFLLRPRVEDGPPRALIHFLGGAIVGAAPQIAYRYLLERLAAKGYLIVASPYNLSFDHLQTCDAILARFEQIAAPLARTYGALPVVGIGHSCGALLQLLITSLFPDTPRAANALISFNNKPVSEAVPAFEEVVAPFFTFVAARNDTLRNSGGDVIAVSLQLAKAAAVGELPDDPLLSRAVQLLVPPGFESLTRDKQVMLPKALRDAWKSVTAPTIDALRTAGVDAVPVLYETLEVLEQIPLLIEEVADGARDFVPTPSRVKTAARRAYRARRTLIVKYSDDNLDESDEIEELLNAAGQVIRMKRPMVQIDVQRRNLTGIHATPLLAPPLDLATRAETILGEQAAKERLYYASADQTVEELVRWLEESNL